MKADDSEIQDAHAIISNNLKKNKIESMQEWINERYRDLENQNLMPSKKQYVIFIKFEAILELYNFYDTHWSKFQDSKYRSLLEDCIVTELLNTHSEEEYVVFDTESVSNIREDLLSFF